MNLRDVFNTYNELKNNSGLIKLELKIRDLEEEKYMIQGYDYRERVQTSRRISNNRIDNINSRINKLKVKLQKSKNFINDTDYFFNLIYQKEFKTLLDLYTNYKNEKIFKELNNISDSKLYKDKQVIKDTLEIILRNSREVFIQVWVELFNGDPKKLTPIQSREINDLLNQIEGWKKAKSNLSFGKSYGKQRAFTRI